MAKSIISGIFSKGFMADKTGRSEPKIRGENFYVHTPESKFYESIKSWISYLGINDLFPNIGELESNIIEISSKMRQAGNASFLGITEDEGKNVMIRPGDYSTLLHELTHTNNEFKEKLMSAECGAFALEIFSCGNIEEVLNILMRSYSYKDEDKKKGRIIAEASVVLGKRAFDVLRKSDNKTSLTDLVMMFKNETDSLERDMKSMGMSAEDYLVGMHKITKPVAEMLISLTGDSANTIVRSTSQSKKEYISAFKSLVSFYHINLGYSLDDSISKTEELFRKKEALTIHKTLVNGSKEVFAKLKEYGYPAEICKKVSEIILSYGATDSMLYAKSIPALLEVTGHYGPNGKDILELVLSNKKMFDIMTIGGISEGLLELSKTEPDQIPMLIRELAKYEWDHELTISGSTLGRNLDVASIYKSKSDGIMRLLSQEKKAELTAFSLYLSSMTEEEAEKLVKNKFRVTWNASKTIDIISEYSKQGKDMKKIYKLIDSVKSDLALPEPKNSQKLGNYKAKKTVEDRD